jgi:hypothetical protein
MNNCYVYRHRRLDNNEIFYVGLGSVYKKHEKSNGFKTLYERAFSKSGRSSYWNKVFNKSGYLVEIVASNLTREYAEELEIFLISEYKRKDCCGGTLVNLTDGGEGVSGHTWTDEQKLQASIDRKGDGNPNYGNTWTEEQKKIHSLKLSGENASCFGRVGELHPMFGKKGEFNPNYGSKRTEETKNNTSKSKKGKKGAEKTPLQIQQFADRNSKKVINTENGVIYSSIKEASEKEGVNWSTLRWYLQNPKSNKTKLEYYNN